MSYLISMFIDNELDIDEKIELVEYISGSDTFRDETIALLKQEKRIRSEGIFSGPAPDVIPLPRPKPLRFRSVAGISSALAALAAILIWVFMIPGLQADPVAPYRFVIFQPDINRIDITGTFTQWQPEPMKPIGDTGYWEIALDVPKGEHRFAYILGGNQRIADPTVLTRENDDFGGENSILTIGI